MADPASIIPPVTTLPNPHATAEYGALAVIVAVAVGMVLAIMVLVRVISRANGVKTPDNRLTTYECGEIPVGQAWFRFNNRFYLIAILFLVCDTMLALFLPTFPRFAAYVGSGQATVALVPILALAGLAGLAVLNAAVHGDLHWNKQVTASGPGEPQVSESKSEVARG